MPPADPPSHEMLLSERADGELPATMRQLTADHPSSVWNTAYMNDSNAPVLLLVSSKLSRSQSGSVASTSGLGNILPSEPVRHAIELHTDKHACIQQAHA